MIVSVRKYRSVEDMMDVTWAEPGTEEHHRSVAAVIRLVSLFAPKRTLPPGVFRYRSVEEAQSERERWEANRITASRDDSVSG